jgi:REP element-mobilizing transposase RayT
VFLDGSDRTTFLHHCDRISARLGWRILGYCLMGNHYHLVLQTPGPTLARGMRDLNGAYAQRFNRVHDHVGHVFQGRYHAIVVERGSYLLELIRYVVLNPVRAGLCSKPTQWPWSSHQAVLGRQAAIAALDWRGVLAPFGAPVRNARAAYNRFVLAGIGLPPPVAGEIDRPGSPVSGSPAFRARVVGRAGWTTREMPRWQRRLRELETYEKDSDNRDEAIRAAYASGHHSLAAIGRHFGLHYSTVSKICRFGGDC